MHTLKTLHWRRSTADARQRSRRPEKTPASLLMAVDGHRLRSLHKRTCEPGPHAQHVACLQVDATVGGRTHPLSTQLAGQEGQVRRARCGCVCGLALLQVFLPCHEQRHPWLCSSLWQPHKHAGTTQQTRSAHGCCKQLHTAPKTPTAVSSVRTSGEHTTSCTASRQRQAAALAVLHAHAPCAPGGSVVAAAP